LLLEALFFVKYMVSRVVSVRERLLRTECEHAKSEEPYSPNNPNIVIFPTLYIQEATTCLTAYIPRQIGRSIPGQNQKNMKIMTQYNKSESGHIKKNLPHVSEYTIAIPPEKNIYYKNM